MLLSSFTHPDILIVEASERENKSETGQALVGSQGVCPFIGSE